MAKGACANLCNPFTIYMSHVIFNKVIRRTGCVLCREAALELSSRFYSGEYTGAKLVGIIKSVEKKSDVKTSKYLGVEEFQTDYFMNYPVYLDVNMDFYKFLGSKSILSQDLPSWNPFKLYADIVSINNRIRSKNINGNLTGEGFVKGGLLLVNDSEGLTYRHDEVTGAEIPFSDLSELFTTPMGTESKHNSDL